MVTVVKRALALSRKKQPMDDVTEEVGLLGFAILLYAYVRQHLFLENLFRIFDALLACGAYGGTTLTDVVECYVLVLDDEGLFERWSEHFHHLLILEVVHD